MVAVKEKFQPLYALEKMPSYQKACSLVLKIDDKEMQALCFEIAEILTDLHLDEETILSGMVAVPFQRELLSIDIITEQLGENIAKLASHFVKLNAMGSLANVKKRSFVQIDRLRQALLAMASDIRVVIIQLAERTCLMRRIKQMNSMHQKILAEETLHIYAPLANCLGIGHLKWELEDLSFRYTHPEIYKTIAAFLAERRIDRENRIQLAIIQLKESLEKAHINPILSGRAKHIYSIFMKMQQKELGYHHIFDYSALRILVPTLEDCYHALSIVHELWERLPQEFDDYIANPKPNGYRSIHTAVIGPDGKNMEIQIRTHDMHNEAEHGVAAHWIYKENNAQHAHYENKINFLRQLLDWHQEGAKEAASSDLRRAIFEDRVYVFTPLGDIQDLPSGATPIDFAYQIHSNLGHRLRGAKVNGNMVPLNYILQTGDQIEILAHKEGSPSRDWLNKELGYLKTSRARAKILTWFRQQDVPMPQRPSSIEPLRTKDVPVKQVSKVIAPTRFIGAEGFLTRIAKCCKPIPGDAILGYITQGRGLSIHRKNCQNIRTHHASRCLDVDFCPQKSDWYTVDLKIEAYGKEDVTKAMMTMILNLKVNFIKLDSTINKKSNKISLLITISIHDLNQLKQVMASLKSLPYVIDVKRTHE